MTFDVAAEAYDGFMGRYYTMPLAPVFADAAKIPTGGRVLDVGCGTGALTRVLIDRFGPDQVAGVDPSVSFVAAAAERFPWTDIRHGAAEALPFDDDTFDATLAQLVVHFMTDAAAGVREMIRVTRPGGIVAACVWDFAGHRAPHSVFFDVLTSVADGIDDQSGRVGVQGGDLPTLLRDAGCVDVTETEVTVTAGYSGFDEWWSSYRLGVAPAGRQLAALSESDRERVRTRCAELFPSGPFTIVATAWSARGLAP